MRRAEKISQMHRRDVLKLLSASVLLPYIGCKGQAIAKGEHPSDGQRPNVLIFLFDTLSARNMSLYGYRRDTTPNLSRVAARSNVYRAHHAAGNFTTPSTASLLSGTYPWTHRAFHYAGIVAKDREHRNLFELLGDTYQRIAYPHNLWTAVLLNQFRQGIDLWLPPEMFSLLDGTYHDRYFSNDLDAAFRGFEDLLFRQLSLPGSFVASFIEKIALLLWEKVGLAPYADLYPRGVPVTDMYHIYFLLEDVIDGLMTVLGDSRQPYLGYFHLYPPHEPYRPHRSFVGIFEDGWEPVTKEPHPLSPQQPQKLLNQMRLEYDEYVANVDAEFGRLWDFLDMSGILDQSYVVFTSDHGQLFERGYHGHDTPLLYQPLIHIPLLISQPGQKLRRDIFTPTSSVDLLPSLLKVSGRPIPPWCEGEILPGLSDETGDSERSVFAVEAKRNPADQPLRVGTIALVRGPYKLIHHFGYDGYEDNYELYDLAKDPEELEDLSSSERAIAADLQAELRARLQEADRPWSQ